MGLNRKESVKLRILQGETNGKTEDTASQGQNI
jgi:hypothetical protein